MSNSINQQLLDEKKQDVFTVDINKNQINSEIINIINSNKIDDLKRFIKMRTTLNNINFVLIYIYHIIQSSGVFLTSYATSINNRELIWVGIGFSMLATLLNIFEKINNYVIKKTLKDIEAIKNNNYTDENILIDSNEMNNDPINSDQNNYNQNNDPINSDQNNNKIKLLSGVKDNNITKI